jgi:hypothetical protein
MLQIIDLFSHPLVYRRDSKIFHGGLRQKITVLIHSLLSSLVGEVRGGGGERG